MATKAELMTEIEKLTRKLEETERHLTAARRELRAALAREAADEPR